MLKLENERKDYLLRSYREAQQSNFEIHNSLIAEYEELKEKYELLLVDHRNLQAGYDALKKADVVEESEPSSSDKGFIPDMLAVVVEIQRLITQVFTRARRRTQKVEVRTVDVATTVEQSPEVPVSDPVTAKAERLAEKIVGKRKIDEVTKVTEPAESSKRQKADDTPTVVQAEAEQIEALEINDDWYDEVLEEEEVGAKQVDTESTAFEDIPVYLEERFNYLVQMKYNRVFLDVLTVSQVNEEYEKCIAAESLVPADPNENLVEHGEWEPT